MFSDKTAGLFFNRRSRSLSDDFHLQHEGIWSCFSLSTEAGCTIFSSGHYSDCIQLASGITGSDRTLRCGCWEKRISYAKCVEEKGINITLRCKSFKSDKAHVGLQTKWGPSAYQQLLWMDLNWLEVKVLQHRFKIFSYKALKWHFCHSKRHIITARSLRDVTIQRYRL